MLYRYRIFGECLFARAFERSSEIASHRLNFMRVGGIVALRTVDDISSVPRVSIVLKGTSPPRLNRLNSQTGAVTFRGTCRPCVCDGEYTGRSKREPSHGAHDVFDQIWYGSAARSSALENRSPRANSRGRFCSNRFSSLTSSCRILIENGSHTGKICEILRALTMADNNKRVR